MKIMYVYILQCNDDSYYTGVTNDIDRRFKEHQSGSKRESYTFSRRPLKLVFHTTFNSPDKAIICEKRLKKWSHEKKKALAEGKYELLPELSKKKFD